MRQWRRGPRSTPGTKEQRAKNDDERVFSPICHRRRDSRNLSGVCGILSRCWNPSNPRVSQLTGVRCDDSSGEMRM